jgi:hypothetical protein
VIHYHCPSPSATLLESQYLRIGGKKISFIQKSEAWNIEGPIVSQTLVRELRYVKGLLIGREGDAGGNGQGPHVGQGLHHPGHVSPFLLPGA